jgi:hypothetical protein
MRARPARARRQMAAGDQLRVVYDQLSRDPASLANLDQDLPNYAQHQVPIFSLPQARRPDSLLTLGPAGPCAAPGPHVFDAAGAPPGRPAG